MIWWLIDQVVHGLIWLGSFRMVYLFTSRKARQQALDKTVRLLKEYNELCSHFLEENEEQDLATELMYEGQLISSLDQLGKDYDGILERRIGLIRRLEAREHTGVRSQDPRSSRPPPSLRIRG